MDKWRHSAVYICVFSDACLKTYIFVRASSMNTDSTRDDTVVAWKILGLFMNPETDISITNQSDRPAAVKKSMHTDLFMSSTWKNKSCVPDI